MDKLITLLLNFYFRAKDLHYKALNEGRLGDHAFFNEITDGIFGDIDDIQEVINGIDGKFCVASEIIKDVNGTCLSNLSAILDELEKQAKNKDITDGSLNLLNTLSEKYQKFYSFLRKYRE